jgi:hypothetical protein
MAQTDWKSVHGLLRSTFSTFFWKLKYVVQNLSALADCIVSLKLRNNITVYSESWRKDYGLFQSIIICREEEDEHELTPE